MSLLDTLARRQLVVVTGKGGVGKTTVAAVLARLLAGAGRRVLLVEVDPRESLHQVLGTEPSGGEIVEAGPGLRVQNVQAQRVIEELVREKVPVGFLSRKITGSPAFQHAVAGAPGLKEVAVLGYAYRAVAAPKAKVDVVVVDAPATGHGLGLLTAPALLADAIPGGQLGEMATDLAAFVADTTRCGAVLATLAEEMPVQETLELVEGLQARTGRGPDLLVANGLYPPFPARAPQGPAEAVGLWKTRRALQDRELARLRQAWGGPLAELTLQPLPRGPELLEVLVALLGPRLKAGAP